MCKEYINHPNHYQTKSGIEAIDVMEAFTEELSGADAVNSCMVLKYMLRWKKKNGVEDLKKARWYLDRLISKNEDLALEASNRAVDNFVTSPKILENKCAGREIGKNEKIRRNGPKNWDVDSIDSRAAAAKISENSNANFIRSEFE